MIGGAEVFRSALPLARRIYLTRVHGTVDGESSSRASIPPSGAKSTAAIIPQTKNTPTR